MPNPTLIHPKSNKIDHSLKIVDFYIHMKCPKVFLVEPKFGEYEPDVYMKDVKGDAICVEVQLTPLSTKKMQTKIDQFTSTFGKEHDAKIMILVSDNNYFNVKMPTDFKLLRFPLPKEPYTLPQKNTLADNG